MWNILLISKRVDFSSFIEVGCNTMSHNYTLAFIRILADEFHDLKPIFEVKYNLRVFFIFFYASSLFLLCLTPQFCVFFRMLIGHSRNVLICLRKEVNDMFYFVLLFRVFAQVICKYGLYPRNDFIVSKLFGVCNVFVHSFILFNNLILYYNKTQTITQAIS